MADSKQKKVIIIGGGVSGMTTGIYLEQSGYDTLILEKNNVAGGACMGWERKGCYIDGCIHWMTGVRKGSGYYDLWTDTHAIEKDTEIYFQEDFANFSFGDKSFTVWANLKKLEKELIDFAPEDTKEIKRFCRYIKRFQKIEGPVDRPVDHMHIFRLLKIAFTMGGDYYWVSKMSKISCAEYGKRFKNPNLRSFFESYMAPGYNLMSMLYMIAHVTAHNGGIPIGGSLPLVRRMQSYYEKLGGTIRTNAEVEKINIDGRRATGVTLTSGEVIEGDWIVSTTAAEHCLKKLLGGKYNIKKLDERLNDIRKYPIYTYTTVVFLVHSDLSDKPLAAHVNFGNPVVMDREYKHITFRNYSYDKTMKRPEGCCVMQAGFLGGDDMYFWWKDKQEKGIYKTCKAEIAEKVTAIAEEHMPELKGKIEVIDMVTPLTYERYLNSRHGSFQGFVHTAKGKSLTESGVVKGLDNFLLSGQCIFHSGGLPPAAITGRFAAQRICKKDGKRFVKNVDKGTRT